MRNFYKTGWLHFGDVFKSVELTVKIAPDFND